MGDTPMPLVACLPRFSIEVLSPRVDKAPVPSTGYGKQRHSCKASSFPGHRNVLAE